MQKPEHSDMVNSQIKYLNEIKSKAVAFCAFLDKKIKEVCKMENKFKFMSNRPTPNFSET